MTSHLRLVAKIAMGYRGYGLPVTSELVSEGSIGLMQAVKKFNPEKGFRLGYIRDVVDKSFDSRICFKIVELSKNGNHYSSKKAFF